MSEINALKLDLPPMEDYNKFHKQLHLPDEEDEKIVSRFSYVMEKRSSGSHMKVKMAHVANETEIIYTASKKFDSLFKAEMILELPSIKVKEKYKSTIAICYPYNLGHHIIIKGELRVNDDPIQAIDSKYLDIYSQYYCEPGMRNLYN